MLPWNNMDSVNPLLQTDIYSAGKILQERVSALPIQNSDTKDGNLTKNVFDDIIRKCDTNGPFQALSIRSGTQGSVTENVRQSSQPRHLWYCY